MSSNVVHETHSETVQSGRPIDRPRRPAWIEIDLKQLRRNYEVINREKTKGLKLLLVVKDEAYGHGGLKVAKAALEAGVEFLSLSNLDEAMALRGGGIDTRILLLGERQDEELPWCVAQNLTCCVDSQEVVLKLGKLAEKVGRPVPVHLKINTGMNRYGVRWTEALALVEFILSTKSLQFEGVLSHFAMSDELDKTFANLQLERFKMVLAELADKSIHVKYRHICNSGGFLDLPQAHFDMVRIGLLQYGVYPSQVCRRIPGIAPVMSVKARIAAFQNIEAEDVVGYGMRYKAPSPRRIGVIPIGYGDGYPRIRNEGYVLIRGRRAPLVGGVAMDAIMVDVTDVPEAQLWEEIVLMGRQGDEEISVHDVARWKNSVSYDILTGWRARLPRIYLS
ncbi:alanine racemase [Pedosphaera parvula]|uniref:Alanine racemase n=1 Tax=Pedosphaera parvula (strain Ellin514) TaxID=320771 RepID=B9XMA7_PEDPL|nr:alanine racemase [Pedosphaera parvula]EEF58949.1 alanine racemase [Pedosphaera parvula Ellin514]